MSTHNCPVVRVQLSTHPNADKLAIATVGGYRCVVKKDDFREGDLAVYVPPDYCVNTAHPAFAFLGSKSRITIRRFRGVVSDGLMLPLSAFPELVGAAEGDNALEALGISRWEPATDPTDGPRVGKYDGAPTPDVPEATVKYDLEALKQYPDAFDDNEFVVVTEKIHGSNLRLVLRKDGEILVGSRSRWLKRPAEGEPIPAHFACLTDEFVAWFRRAAVVNRIVYGEVYGASVQGAKFAYDAAPGTVRVRLFSAGNDTSLYPPRDSESDIDAWDKFRAPFVTSGRWCAVKEQAATFVAEGKSLLAANQVCEGVVISALDRDYFTDKRGNQFRAALKLISPTYYETTG